MVNFDLILQMIQQIDSGNIPSNITFNDFCIKFFLETKQIPLSKFLKMRGFSNKMPKIMNTRKAGELLIESKDNDDIKEILSKYGFIEFPQLNFSSVMLLRKTSIEKNWIKVLEYIKGQGTIEQIVRKNMRGLLPEEQLSIEEFIKKELNINSIEFLWLQDIFSKIISNKKVFNSLKKLS